jgi:predicted ATPase
LADETKAAFEHASQLASQGDGGPERFAAYYGRWVVTFTREEIADCLRIAQDFLADAESAGQEMEAGAACRALGLSLYVAGDFKTAQTRLVQAIRLHKPEHDDESRRLFGYDPQAGAVAYLACVNLARGKLSTAREMIEAAVARADGLGHIPTRANVWLFRATYEAMRGDPEATLPAANTLHAVSRQGGLALYITCGEAIQGWARARLGDLEDGTAIFRQSRAKLVEQGGLVLSPFFAGLLAGLDAERRHLDDALALVDETVARAAKTGSHFNDSRLHRLRGEILLLRDPADPVPAEAAYQTALAVAKQQGARSFELLSALSLAKLYQSTARPADAHAVLAPALEGFSPTPEMPEIVEAQALKERLA